MCNFILSVVAVFVCAQLLIFATVAKALNCLTRWPTTRRGNREEGKSGRGRGEGHTERERVSRFACLLLVQSLRKVIENVNGRDTRTSGKC